MVNIETLVMGPLGGKQQNDWRMDKIQMHINIIDVVCDEKTNKQESCIAYLLWDVTKSFSATIKMQEF